jgi:hypothetical protein
MNDLFFAVKTTKKYHNDRGTSYSECSKKYNNVPDFYTVGYSIENLCILLIVPVIKNTIGQRTSRVVYYSETVDPSIPTEDTGVPNTETGKQFMKYVWK